jgi:hypothetical protein
MALALSSVWRSLARVDRQGTLLRQMQSSTILKSLCIQGERDFGVSRQLYCYPNLDGKVNVFAECSA